MPKKVLVLSGGTSNEREVSLRSGKNVADSLIASGYEVVLADTAAPGFDLAAACRDTEAVIPMLHGAGGEDGTLQRALDELKAPYFGSGAAACALTFDKVATKERLSEHGVLTPSWEVVTLAQFKTSDLRRKSYVLKPTKGGSSIDTLIVHNPDHQAFPPSGIQELFRRHPRMLLEELVEGQEVTVGVLGEKPLPVILIVPPPGEEFDYENKYNGRTREIARPPQVPAALQRRIQEVALHVHRLTGCRHLSRTDIILACDGSLYVLEINTLPGMTAQSLVPKAAAAAGISMERLARQFVSMTEQS